MARTSRGPARWIRSIQAIACVIIEVGQAELRDGDVREDRIDVRPIAADGDVEREGRDAGQQAQLVFEVAGFAAVDEDGAAQECEVVIGQAEARHPRVPVKELAVPMDEPHVRVRVRPRHDPDMRGVDPLGLDGSEDVAPGAIVADRADVRGFDTGSLGLHGDVEGLPAGEHHPEVAVAVDDVVAHAGQLHG